MRLWLNTSSLYLLSDNNILSYVYRCAPVLSIVIRVLQSSLAASRSQLSRHLQDGPITSIPLSNPMSVGNLTNDTEREELKNALIAAQESAAIQILLESCLQTPYDCVCASQLILSNHTGLC